MAGQMEVENIVILLDMNSMGWLRYSEKAKKCVEENKKTGKQQVVYAFEDVMETIVYVLTIAYSKNNNNKTFVYVYDEKDVRKIFPADPADDVFLKLQDFAEVKKRIMKQLHGVFLAKSSLNFTPHSHVISALSKSICALQKLKTNNTNKQYKMDSRIIMVHNSEMEKNIYGKLMNCIFVLDSRNIVLDVIDLYNKDPYEYLKQAALKQKGVHFNLSPADSGMFQYLCAGLLISNSERNSSCKMPYKVEIEYKGSCSCHNAQVDVGYVCSVCLGVYCGESFKKHKDAGICVFCKERFDLLDYNAVVVPPPALASSSSITIHGPN